MTAGCRSWGEHQATEEQVRARQGSSGIDKKGGYSWVRFAGAKIDYSRDNLAIRTPPEFA